MKVRMKAERSFRYATRMLQAGDEFEATRQDARVLSAIGNAAEAAKPAPKEAAAPATVDEGAGDVQDHGDTQGADDEPVKRRRGRPAKSRD